MAVCSVCGHHGHNARTCPDRHAQQHACSVCGQQGHNARSHGQAAAGAGRAREAEHVAAGSGPAQQAAAPAATPARRQQICGLCGQPGHNSRTCPEQQQAAAPVGGQRHDAAARRHTCGLCGLPGHNLRTCLEEQQALAFAAKGQHHTCGSCGQPGHNSRTCPQQQQATTSVGGRQNHAAAGAGGKVKKEWEADAEVSPAKKQHMCGFCGQPGHNSRTCPEQQQAATSVGGRQKHAAAGAAEEEKMGWEAAPAKRQHMCGVCGQPGHKSRTCPEQQRAATSVEGQQHGAAAGAAEEEKMGWEAHAQAAPARRQHMCGVCGQPGHKSRTCPEQQRAATSVGGQQNHAAAGAEEDEKMGWEAHTEATSIGRQNMCRFCGQPGHKSRTCPEQHTTKIEGGQQHGAAAGAAEEEKKEGEVGAAEAAPARRQQACGICGQPGHKSRTCPEQQRAAMPVRGQHHGAAAEAGDREKQNKEWEADAEAAPSKRQYVCGLCGQPGHNSRMCAEQMLAAETLCMLGGGAKW
ncbi:hypothetical protein DUNSADRAFT_13407 [Dunaliella salina]|uniref:CCHC-type domain-containing protein n=1 Tax=Dunaliella salina TaxID=3046 RepID=A0ABQ7H393_DUNSA|nr:hypothetical protein DUNSADRAFT_13407 [Dunaliella salina]|eukprot:KAF5841331.1 hypothetical protein DUNSADRAFT_13407 [Dunaliella salina]